MSAMDKTSRPIAQWHLRVGIRIVAGLVAGGVLVAASQTGYESEPRLRASELLPANLLSGPHHEVIDEVRNDGYMNRFRIASDFGRFEAYGRAELVVRVYEIAALAELDRLSRTRLFVEGIESSAKGTAQAVGSVVTEPVETVKRLPGGVKRMFKRASSTVKKGAETVEERVDSDQESDLTDDAADAASAAFKRHMGITAGERRWAQTLGVDPYTSNEPLWRAIKRAARYGAAGGIVVKLATPQIPGLGAIKRVSGLVWSKDPRDLIEYNRQQLVALGASVDLVAAFLDNPTVSPSQKTALTSALAALDGVANRFHALQQGATVANEDEARFLLQSVRMLVWVNAKRMPVAELLPGERILIGRTDDGSEAIFAPVDHLVWTEGIAALAGRRSAQTTTELGRRRLYLMGGLSARCRRELETLGWQVDSDLRARLALEPPTAAGAQQ